MSDIAIKVQNLSKLYRIGTQKSGSLRHSLADKWGQLTGRKATDVRDFWALDDLSFEIERGEAVGIIGRNGAGKSTLLKILSRITQPTKGRIEINGRVASLLEVGTGFHPELTGRENIYLNGTILGMTRREIRSKFDEIVDFSGVEKFIDTPVKYYSSGMYVRLAFAVAAHLDPEILIIDEVLAVGDAEFQSKCLGKMEEVTSKGRTVLFVSHNMGAIDSLCNTAIVLHKGQLLFNGDKNDAIAAYTAGHWQDQQGAFSNRVGSGAIQINRIELRNKRGDIVDMIPSGGSVGIYLHFSRLRDISTKVVASISVKTSLGYPVFLHHGRLNNQVFEKLPGSGVIVFEIARLPMPPSAYSISVDIRSYDGSDCYDYIEDAIKLNVVEGNFFGYGEVPPISHGMCLVEGNWFLEKV